MKREPEALWKLAARADILIESFRPGRDAETGFIVPAVLCEKNPRLIVCSISGYGQTGPLKDRAGHDLNYMARAGVLARMETPRPLPLRVADLAGGALFPATAILAALYAREKTGRGTHIDAAMLDGALALQPLQLAAQTQGVFSDPLAGGVPCYNVYPTRDDRWLALAALEPKFWERFCAVVDHPQWQGAALLSGEEGARVWWREIRRWRLSSKRSRRVVCRFCRRGLLPRKPVLDPAENSATDAHLCARGMFWPSSPMAAPSCLSSGRRFSLPIPRRRSPAPQRNWVKTVPLCGKNSHCNVPVNSTARRWTIGPNRPTKMQATWQPLSKVRRWS